MNSSILKVSKIKKSIHAICIPMNVLFVYWIFFYIILVHLSSAMGSHGIFDQLCLVSQEAYSSKRKKTQAYRCSLEALLHL